MARKTEEQTIGDLTFRVQALGYEDAARVFMRVVKVAGPALAALAESKAGIKDLALASVVTTALEKCSYEDLAWLTEIMGKSTQVLLGDKEPYLTKGVREEIFSGKVLLSLKWLGFCLEHNYGDFADAFRG